MLSIDIKNIEQARQLFGSPVVDNALRSMQNKLLAKSKTAISKAARQSYNIKARDLNKAIKLHRTRRADQPAFLIASGPRLSLIQFDAQETRIRGNDAIISRRALGKTGGGGLVSRKVRAGKKQKGVSVKVRKDRGRKLVKGNRGFGGFIAHANGRPQIFERLKKSRLPIEKLTGPAIAQMLGKNTDAVENVINSDAGRIFNHELDFFLQRALKNV